MSISPEPSPDKKLVSFLPIENAQVNRSGDSEGRQYVFRPKYKSGWEILPDLVINLVRGCEIQQEFKMHSYGLYQGTVRVRLFNGTTYSPKIGHSGSLEVVYMVQPVLKFLSLSALSLFYGLKDEETIDVISSLFEEVVKGTVSKTFSISDDFEIEYKYSNERVSLCVVKQDPLENHSSTIELAKEFFNSIDLSFVFGKIKENQC